MTGAAGRPRVFGENILTAVEAIIEVLHLETAYGKLTVQVDDDRTMTLTWGGGACVFARRVDQHEIKVVTVSHMCRELDRVIYMSDGSVRGVSHRPTHSPMGVAFASVADLERFYRIDLSEARTIK